MLSRRGFLGGATAATLARPALASSAIDNALRAIGDARFIVIGERHDNPEHHRMQAALVKALAPAGLAFEMIPRALEDIVNRLRREGASRTELGEALEWKARGWPDWSQYAPILEAAPDAYIAGGALSRERTRAIYSEGAVAGLPEHASAYGLDEPLPETERAALIEEQFEAHCRMMPREQLGPMVEVQRAWDAAYAEAWRRAAERGGGRAVLICGNAHARLDRGAPAYLKRVLPYARIVSIGLLENEDGAESGEAFDATLTAPTPPREDPCEKMRAHMSR